MAYKNAFTALRARNAMRKVLQHLQDPGSPILSGVAKIRCVAIGVLGFKFGSNSDKSASRRCDALKVMTGLVDEAKTNVVLIVDEFQQSIPNEEGNRLLLAFKFARDAVNLRARIANTDGDAKGLFSADAASEYSKAIGREVKIEEIQSIVNELMAANIAMRRGHGLYGISDPFVQEVWRERQTFLF